MTVDPNLLTWFSTVTAGLAVAGVGYILRDISDHRSRLGVLEATSLTYEKHTALQEVTRAEIAEARKELAALRDRVRDLES